MGGAGCCSTPLSNDVHDIKQVVHEDVFSPEVSSSCWRCEPEVRHTDKLAIFVSSQSTSLAWSTCKNWMNKMPPSTDVRMSATSFNLGQICEGLPEGIKQIDVPCFGAINDAVMELFTGNIELMNVATNLGMHVPRYRVDTYLQSQMGIVRELAVFARSIIRSERLPRGNLAKHEAAANKLESFAKAFAALDANTINSISDWKAFVEKYVPPQWESRLAFKDVLGNFGFDDELSKVLRQEIYQEANDHIGKMREVNWEQYAVRWVSKALSAFKPNGCLTDVVNLIFAMTGQEASSSSSEFEVAREVRNFKERVQAGRTKNMWVPSHIMIDCGADDMLCWCLLQHIHNQRSTSLSVLAQLPIHESVDTVERLLKEQPNCKIFRDSASMNLGNLLYYWRIEKSRKISGLFLSGQLTKGSWRACDSWMTDMPADADIRISACPFNLPELPAEVATFPVGVVKLDVPCYGGILDAVMELFTVKDVLACAKRMKIRIPEYKIDTFLKSKQRLVKDMVVVARARAEKLDSVTGVRANLEAATKLEAFAKAFENIDEKSIRNIEEWKQFVGQHVPQGWEKRLAFENVLGNFGFDDEFAAGLRSTTVETIDPKTGAKEVVTWQHRAVRWISKALGGYKPVGCLADVVNLVFAMLGYTAAEVASGLSEETIIDTILKFKAGLEKKDYSSFWIPHHVMLDCESDDMLLWCLLESIHNNRGSELSVLAQLPEHSDADYIADSLQNNLGCKIFRDPDSSNLEAVKHYWDKSKLGEKTS